MIGTIAEPTVKPRPASASQSMTPAAASRPKAEPPDSTTASMRSTRVPGASNSVSRLPGAPAADIDRSGCGCFGEHDGGAADPGLVLGLTNQNPRHIGDQISRTGSGRHGCLSRAATANPAYTIGPRRDLFCSRATGRHRVNRRDLFVLWVCAGFAQALPARAQQKAMPVIGALNSTSPDPNVPLVAAFREGLNRSGLCRGKKRHDGISLGGRPL